MLDLRKWLNVFDYANLEKFFKSEKEKGTVREAIERIGIATVVAHIPIITVYMVILFGLGSTALIAVLFGNGNSAANTALSGIGTLEFAGALILFSIIGIVISIIFFLLTNATQHFIANTLGGKGNYAGMVHMLSFVIAIFAIVTLITNLISIAGNVIASELVNCGMGLFSLATFVYMIYCNYIAIKVNYGLPNGRAFATTIANMAVWFIICAIILVLVFMLLSG